MARLTVVITNAVDEALARQGRLAWERIHRCRAEAVVEPDSVWSVVPGDLARAIGVPFRRQTWTDRITAGPVIVQVAESDTVEEVLVGGNEVRIGRAVIDKLDLFADCGGRPLVPNPDHPDQPVSKIRRRK